MSYNITKKNYLSILKVFLFALIFFGVGSVVGILFIPARIRYYINIAFLILVLFSIFSRKGGFVKSKKNMYIYAVILGILTGSTYQYYFYLLGAETFMSVVLGVILIFGIAYLIALKSSETNIFRLGPIVFSGMCALFILECINIFFFKFGTFDIIISAIGILIYSVYAIVIMKSVQVRCRYGELSEFEVVSLSYSIFISFLNLVIDILRLVAIISDEN